MIKVGDYLPRTKKRILEIINLSNHWLLVKTENSKSKRDFKVRTITDTIRLKYYTPKHAHFAIDFYGKYCRNPEKSKKVFLALIEVWHKIPVNKVLEKYQETTTGLPGYTLEYILYAMNWILEQEDINFTKRSDKLQKKLDEKFKSVNISVPKNRKGSQLAVSIFCDIFKGIHPVEALLQANIDITPKFRQKL
ncbi:MAG: hypothetical protein NZ601_03510 [candidate division WOR-3 bacterium]|nr:hypothetical protein [candidate division WOR-3 bacterium]MCX7756744.1 hypothetical protein [candidate division WOR-3 bacterium]MDW7987662.1 hypothetical protein [candidate division WOR-3 bacterium]